jgi:hypothetical protein
VAFPFAGYWFLSIGYNFYLNIKFNKWWAGGNVYLIMNTVFNVVQGLNAFWLCFEIPIYLRSQKLTRSFSLEMAFFYNLIYLMFLYQLLTFIKDDSVTPMDSFKVMFYAYNLILHAPILPINAIIMFKEL